MNKLMALSSFETRTLFKFLCFMDVKNRANDFEGGKLINSAN